MSRSIPTEQPRSAHGVHHVKPGPLEMRASLVLATLGPEISLRVSIRISEEASY